MLPVVDFAKKKISLFSSPINGVLVDRRRHSCLSLFSLHFSLLVFDLVSLLVKHITMSFFFSLPDLYEIAAAPWVHRQEVKLTAFSFF